MSSRSSLSIFYLLGYLFLILTLLCIVAILNGAYNLKVLSGVDFSVGSEFVIAKMSRIELYGYLSILFSFIAGALFFIGRKTNG